MSFIIEAAVVWLADVIATWGISEFTAWIVANVLVYTATIFAAAGIGKLLRRNPGTGSGIDSGQTQVIRQAAAYRKLSYGQCRLGGVLAYVATSGTDQEYLHMVICHASQESNSFDAYYLNDDTLSLDGSGNETGKYAGYCLVKGYLGTSTQTADPTLMAAMPSEWTSNHRLRGITYTYLRLKHNPDIFVGGIPNLSTLLSGRKVYDPRTSTTYFTSNAMLCLRDYMIDPLDGLGALTSEMDDALVIAGANVCDEAVPLLAGGTEPRYTINGVVDTSTPPGNVIQDMLGAMAGFMPYVGGKFRPQAGAYTAPVQTLTQEDIVGPINLVLGDSLQESFNGVKGTFLSPTNKWQEADFPPYTNLAYRADDNGVASWKDVVLPFTTSTSMAQRLAKIELVSSRFDKMLDVQTKLSCMNIRAGNTIAFTFPKYSWTSKIFQVQSWAFNCERQKDAFLLTNKMVIKEYSSTIYDWTTADEIPVANALVPTIYDPTAIPTPAIPTLSTSNFIQPDGTITPRMLVTWTPPSIAQIKNGGLTWVEYKKTADSTFLTWAHLPGDRSSDYITDIQTGVSYDVRIRFQNVSGVRSLYSPVRTYTPTSDTTAPATPTGLAATPGPNCVVLDWDDNTELDLDHYEVYRAATNSFGSATLIWKGYASQHVDFSAGSGVTYYYWIKAADTTDNKSSQTSSVNAAGDASLSGPAGGFTDFKFKRSASIPSTPTGDNPAGWYDAPPAADGTALYMISGDKTNAGVLIGAWSTPARVSGEGDVTFLHNKFSNDGGVTLTPNSGEDVGTFIGTLVNGSDTSSLNPADYTWEPWAGGVLYMEYSVDGSTSWHSTFTTGDLYARSKVGAGAWGTPYRIVGEQGAQGDPGQDGGAVVASTSGTGNFSTTTYSTILSSPPTAINANTHQISASISMINQHTATRACTLRLYRDTTAIGTPMTVSISAGPNSPGFITLNAADTPGAGTYTYSVKAKVDTNPGDTDTDGVILIQ